MSPPRAETTKRKASTKAARWQRCSVCRAWCRSKRGRCRTCQVAERDDRIIQAWFDDATTPVVELVQQLGISRTTFYERMQRARRHGGVHRRRAA